MKGYKSYRFLAVFMVAEVGRVPELICRGIKKG